MRYYVLYSRPNRMAKYLPEWVLWLSGRPFNSYTEAEAKIDQMGVEGGLYRIVRSEALLEVRSPIQRRLIRIPEE